MEELIERYKKIFLVFALVMIIAPIALNNIIKNQAENLNGGAEGELSQEELVQMFQQSEAQKNQAQQASEQEQNAQNVQNAENNESAQNIEVQPYPKEQSKAFYQDEYNLEGN